MRKPLESSVDRFDAYADEVVGSAAQAAEAFATFDQEQTDRVVGALFAAAFDARHELAELAHAETGMGVVEHKVVKNAWASLLVYEDIRARRSVGVLSEDPDTGITEIAQPKGPILATIPITNPTSTAIFVLLLCAKTRNPVILSPHRGARKCIRRTAELLAAAAAGAGAPPDAIQVLAKAESEYLERVLRHRRLALVVATGTQDIVRKAQASGTPTLGVGPGNVPVYVHASADFENAARCIVHSKTFDNGVVCASEQALVVEPSVDAALRPLLEARGAWFCDAAQTEALGTVCFDAERRSMRADVVGRAAGEIAQRAGFTIPAGKRLLVAAPTGIGPEHPLSHEILAPVLAYYVVPDTAAALAACAAVIRLGGVGHTVAVHARDEGVVAACARLNAGRILVNQPATEGALGGVFNALRPSLTLACGTGAGNLDTDNISVEQLINVHRLARSRRNESWLRVPWETWLDPAIGAARAQALYEREDSTAK